MLNELRFAREQCVVRATDGAVRVQDLGSGCGTFLNGESVSKAAVHANDVLLLANFAFGSS